jgi:hypothetical protein
MWLPEYSDQISRLQMHIASAPYSAYHLFLLPSVTRTPVMIKAPADVYSPWKEELPTRVNTSGSLH